MLCLFNGSTSPTGGWPADLRSLRQSLPLRRRAQQKAWPIMSAGGFQGFVGIIGLLCSLGLAFFHVRRAFSEKGERETRDILLACAFAFGGILAPVFTGVFEGLMTLALPVWIGWVLAIANIGLLGAACTMFNDSKEASTRADRALSERERLFAPHDDANYNTGAIVGFVANVIVFLL
jgi:hypothetical protein